ncbi:RICIN domain-containing protein [Amycolatopsis sp. NBC_00345]|uniref:RICIN domain-containing protein n=1 Tax=Amycolatopsis sp. NBC_00345 TaxID=2975955 RepID=UPI002E266894
MSGRFAPLRPSPAASGRFAHCGRVPPSPGQFNVRNAHSGLLLGVTGMSTQDSAAVVQFHDNGTADHLWQVLPAA